MFERLCFGVIYYGGVFHGCETVYNEVLLVLGKVEASKGVRDKSQEIVSKAFLMSSFKISHPSLLFELFIECMVSKASMKRLEVHLPAKKAP